MTPLDKARIVWPEAKDSDIVWVAPLGSRSSHNETIFWRKGRRVQTGWLANQTDPRSCFEGSLEEFEAAVLGKYKGQGSETFVRQGEDYRAAIAFLKALAYPPAEGVPESGLGPSDIGAVA